MGLHIEKASSPAVILFGSPGSGKGTQAKLLRQRCLAGPHISTGDMLRVQIEVGDTLGQEIERTIHAGKLVPDELVNRLVENRLAQPDCRSGVILDGYPRTLNQAGFLLALAGRYGFHLTVVHLVVDYDKIVARLSGRRQCPVCGTLYSLTTNPPQVPGICDLDGAALITREDDREPVIRERLRQYDLQTRPLIAYFHDAGVPEFEINGADALPGDIAGQICDALRASGEIAAETSGSANRAYVTP